MRADIDLIASSNLPACGPGWEPVPIDDERNAQGYLYKKIDTIYSELQSNPHFLIDPCDYLNQFYWLGNFHAPNSTVNRLDSLNQVYSTNHNNSIFQNFLETPYYIQNINNAAGTVVNCDHFPVHITTLPTINGSQWTPQQLFHYFRVNLNLFLDTSIAKFSPYKQDSYINDSLRWYSANPLSSLLHINMINDGTVIVSDFLTTQDSSRFIVSTLRSPMDGIHPVSGNRAWGISPDNNNGGFVFYTTAIDRVTNVLFDLLNDLGELTPIPSGFERADDLWRSLQDKMINFVNSNGGQASKYSQFNDLRFRPFWILMKEFIIGNLSLSQFKQALGCP